MSGECKPVHNDELSRRATLTLFSWVAGSLVFVPRRSGIEEKITVFLATRWTPTSERSFQASFQSMHPNLVGVLVSVGIILLLFSGELFTYAVEKIISRRGPPKCSGERCGEFGWTVARKDSESCHALCVKCGWMSHFDIKRWQELNRR